MGPARWIWPAHAWPRVGGWSSWGSPGRPTVEVAVDDLVVKDQTMVGSIGSPGVWPEVIALVESGALRPSALVTHVLDLAEVAAAEDLLRRRDPAVGKVLIAPNGPPN